MLYDICYNDTISCMVLESHDIRWKNFGLRGCQFFGPISANGKCYENHANSCFEGVPNCAQIVPVKVKFFQK